MSRRIGTLTFKSSKVFDELVVLRLRLVDADGVERHLGIVLVLLIHFLQVRQALPARAAPGGPEVEHGDLSGQRGRRDGLAVEIGELEVGRRLAQQLRRAPAARRTSRSPHPWALRTRTPWDRPCRSTAAPVKSATSERLSIGLSWLISWRSPSVGITMRRRTKLSRSIQKVAVPSRPLDLTR